MLGLRLPSVGSLKHTDDNTHNKGLSEKTLFCQSEPVCQQERLPTEGRQSEKIEDRKVLDTSRRASC